MCECYRQSKAEVVSNSSNTNHQTWGQPFSRALCLSKSFCPPTRAECGPNYLKTKVVVGGGSANNGGLSWGFGSMRYPTCTQATELVSATRYTSIRVCLRVIKRASHVSSAPVPANSEQQSIAPMGHVPTHDVCSGRGCPVADDSTDGLSE